MLFRSVADPDSREVGLSNHDLLPENMGMLFLFPNMDNRFFWMKGMQFSIDIVWIKTNKIVGIDHNVPLSPGPNYPHYISPVPVDKVLEINAGRAKELGLAPGQTIKFHLGKEQNIR